MKEIKLKSIINLYVNSPIISFDSDELNVTVSCDPVFPAGLLIYSQSHTRLHFRVESHELICSHISVYY